jgi:hypothetical protein
VEVVLDGSYKFPVYLLLRPAVFPREQRADARCLDTGFLWGHRRDGLACGAERSQLLLGMRQFSVVCPVAHAGVNDDLGKRAGA